ncbi:MAG: protein O-mannosyl-transferase family [Gemmatimonadaceae bacterium]
MTPSDAEATGRVQLGGIEALTLLLSISVVVSIAAGYALLWRGGTTSAAALLVLGYCLFIPVVILRRPSGAAVQPHPNAERPPYLAAILAGVVVLILYLVTLSPSTAMWDTSEYMAAAKVLGLPHPPGNPLFILIAHLFGALPIAATFAQRINVLAALSSAAAAGLWFLIAHAALARVLPTRWARFAGAAAAVAFSASAFTVWNQSVVNEKVYTVSLLQTVLVCWLAIRWAQQREEKGSDRLLLLALYLCALGYTIHPAGLFALAPLGAVVLVNRPSLLARGRLLIAAALLFIGGLTPFAFEPIRSAWDPAINEGEPTACAGKIGLACTMSSVTLDRLRANVNREQYAKPALTDRQAPLGAQFGMWWLYWKWQWFRDGRAAAPPVQLFLALGALVLAAAGANAQWKNDRNGFIVMAALVATVTPVLIYYLNFKYGASQSPELAGLVDREVRDRDYFFVWSFSALGVWMGLGLASLWSAVATRASATRAGAARAATARTAAPQWRLSSPLLALALVPMLLNWRDASRAGQSFTSAWARDVLQSAQPGAVLVTNGDNDTFPLWYAQNVEGLRRDVTVVVGSYLGTDWAPWQLARRVPETYVPAPGEKVWSDARVPSARPVIQASQAELNLVPPYEDFREQKLFVHGDIRARIGPGVATRDQLIVLRIIRDSFPDRPVAFTAALLPMSVGLGEYTVRQGLVWTLVPQRAATVTGVVPTSGGAIDLQRSRTLWREVYGGAAQLEREGDWLDEPSLSIPLQYVILGSTLAEALRSTGATAEAEVVEREVHGVYRAARIARLERASP